MPSPDPAPKPAITPAPASSPLPVDLKELLLPADWSLAQLEAEARRTYFDDLVANPPQTPAFTWLEKRTLIISGTEGGFQKVFGKTTGWSQYRHQKTGELDPERLRRAPWIRPVLEMRVPKTRIYVNNHSMKPRQFGPKARQEKKRIFITLGKEVIFFISLVYTEHGLALGTAFPPDGEWLRKMQAESTLLGP
ncbi:MAG: hypothetical protein ACYDH9_12295 [Limisphaerales bacterium]